MTGVLHPHELLGFVRDTSELERVLEHGDGIAFPGDPALELHQGVITAPNGRDILARRWEVWRNCEDGQCRIIGHWRIEEYDRIIFDLTRMRGDSPGFTPTVDKIEKVNEQIEAENTTKFRDSAGAMLEHAAKLHHDTTEPRNVFRGLPGLRDENPAVPPAAESTDS